MKKDRNVAIEADKQCVAYAALEYIQNGDVIGVGTGSTVDCFIQLLPYVKHKIEACVASSQRTANQLLALGLEVVDLNQVQSLPLYIDGADEINPNGQMIKGGGGALTREKIIATVAHQFLCIVDHRKWVDYLGRFPVPLEVIPMARSLVARACVKMGGSPEYRTGIVTDNGNHLLEVYFQRLNDPLEYEKQLSLLVGVVESGIFARRCADIVLVGEKGHCSIKSLHQ
jgi:ribose 5-phosphate isomerase A